MKATHLLQLQALSISSFGMLQTRVAKREFSAKTEKPLVFLAALTTTKTSVMQEEAIR